MAKNSVADWDTTAANNTDIGGISILGAADVKNFDNAFREMMAQVKTGVPVLTTTNTFTKIQKWAKGADVASASALTLGDDGNYFDITGTTTITSIATKGVGTVVKLHFDAALTLTHHATDLILPGGASITTAAGDEAEFVEYATGDWRCINYQRANGLSAGFSSGAVIQRRRVEFTNSAVSTTAIPFDNTIPQITEGDSLLSTTITPLRSDSTIRVTAIVPGTADGLRNVMAALFVNGASNAVATGIKTTPAADYFVTVEVVHSYAPGGTSTQTIALRVGPGGGSFYINRASGGDIFGTARPKAELLIEELAA